MANGVVKCIKICSMELNSLSIETLSIGNRWPLWVWFFFRTPPNSLRIQAEVTAAMQLSSEWPSRRTFLRVESTLSDLRIWSHFWRRCLLIGLATTTIWLGCLEQTKKHAKVWDLKSQKTLQHSFFRSSLFKKSFAVIFCESSAQSSSDHSRLKRPTRQTSRIGSVCCSVAQKSNPRHVYCVSRRGTRNAETAKHASNDWFCRRVSASVFGWRCGVLHFGTIQFLGNCKIQFNLSSNKIQKYFLNIF